MEEYRQVIRIKKYSWNELTEEEKTLMEAACTATQRSYAPYSNFCVGAAVLLANGMVVTGTNQENAAYPSGICAERTALFYANSQYPDQEVKALAIAARTSNGFTDIPISPCGACRQVILETERRYGNTIHILLYSNKDIYKIYGAKDLLPLSFDSDCLQYKDRL